MGNTVLWVEAWVVGVLWIAAMFAVTARLESRGVRWLIWIIALGLPLIAAIFGLGMLIVTANEGIAMDFYHGVAFNVGGVIGATALAGGLLAVWRKRIRSVPLTAAAWAVAVAAWVVTFLVIDGQMRDEAAQLQAEAKAQLESHAPTPLADSENAFALTEKWQAELDRLEEERSFEEFEFVEDFLQEGEISPQKLLDEPYTEVYLETYAEVFALIEETVKLPGRYSPYDPSDPEGWHDPQLMGYLSTLEPLRVRSLFAMAHGDHDAAWRDIRAVLHLAEHALDRPTLISKMVASAMRSGTIRTFEHLLDQPLSAEQLDKYLAEWIPVDSMRTLHHVLRYEYANTLAWMAGVALGELPGTFMNCCNGDSNDPGARSSLATPFYRVFALPTDIRAMRHFEKRLTALGNEGAYDDDASRHDDIMYGPLSYLTVPLVDGNYDFTKRWQANYDLLHVAFAIQRYRHDHDGAAPEDASQLVPNYLPESVLDTWANAPFTLTWRDNDPTGKVKLQSASVKDRDDEPVTVTVPAWPPQD